MKKIITLLLILLAGCTGIQLEETSGDVSKYVLDNGITVILKENPATGLAAIDLFVKQSNANEEIPGINNFVNRMLLAGTEKRTRDQIIEEIENTGGTISAPTYTEYSEIKILVPSSKLSTGLEILADTVKNPKFDMKEIEKEREQITGIIKENKDIPQVQAEELFMETLYAGHPYERPPDGYEETVKEITREQLLAHKQKYYTGSNIVISIAGNIKKQPTIKAIKKLFGSIPKGEPSQPAPPMKTWTKTHTREENHPSESFFVHEGYIIPPATNKDFIPLRAVQGILGVGSGSRLFYELRDLRALAYSTYGLMPTVRSNGFIRFTIITKPKTLEEAKEGIQTEIEKLKKDGVENEELNHVKNKMKGFYLLDHQRSADQANYLGFFELQGLGYEHDAEYPEKLQQVTPEDVSRVADQYLNNPQTAIVGPFESIIK